MMAGAVTSVWVLGGRGYRPLCRSSSVLSNVYSIFFVVSEVTGTLCGWRCSLFPCSEQLRVSIFCFLVPQWIHIMRQSLGAFGLFPNLFLRAGGPRRSRSWFGVLVSPQEYRKPGFGFVSVFFYLRWTADTVHTSVC